jgi:hypothetical protein
MRRSFKRGAAVLLAATFLAACGKFPLGSDPPGYFLCNSEDYSVSGSSEVSVRQLDPSRPVAFYGDEYCPPDFWPDTHYLVQFQLKPGRYAVTLEAPAPFTVVEAVRDSSQSASCHETIQCHYQPARCGGGQPIGNPGGAASMEPEGGAGGDGGSAPCVEPALQTLEWEIEASKSAQPVFHVISSSMNRPRIQTKRLSD